MAELECHELLKQIDGIWDTNLAIIERIEAKKSEQVWIAHYSALRAIPLTLNRRVVKVDAKSIIMDWRSHLNTLKE